MAGEQGHPTAAGLAVNQREAAEQYLAKLARWDSLLNLGEPGKRQLRKAIRAEMHPIKRALLIDSALRPKETTP